MKVVAECRIKKDGKYIMPGETVEVDERDGVKWVARGWASRPKARRSETAGQADSGHKEVSDENH